MSRKRIRPSNNKSSSSISSGQVLHCPYNYEKTKLIIKEMTELLVLDLVDKHVVTNQIVLDVGYDIEIVNYNWIHFNISISNRREVDEDMEEVYQNMHTVQ